jgi:glycosyltransferase involved in cell wall biosynthesis
MPEEPLVSIITAIYNGEAFLKETIASVLAQDYANWEYWVVDDGSTDRTTKMLREAAADHSDRIHYLEHAGHKNRGLCASRNFALSKTRGKYIAVLDGDDVWHPTKLSDQIAIAQLFPEAGLIYGRSEYWHGWSSNAADKAKDHVPELAPGERLYQPPELLELNYPLGRFGTPCPSDVLIEREVFSRLGGFEESFDRVQSHYEDIAFLAKLYLACPVYVSNRCWDRYRIHASSMWATGERTGMAEVGRRAYFEWAREYFVSHGVTSKEIWRLWARQTLRYRHPVLYGFQRARGRLCRMLDGR